MNPIRVLVVDDSFLMRKLIQRILSTDSEIQVVATAANGLEALEKAEIHHPDVITLDIEMPKMDGLSFLKTYSEKPERNKASAKIMVLSSLTEKGADVTFKALELGALDFVHKPSGSISLDLQESSSEILQKIKALASEKYVRSSFSVTRLEPEFKLEKSPVYTRASHYDVLAIGASTGGPQALRKIVKQFHSDFPLPVVIVQHMPAGFTESFAENLNQFSKLKVLEARDNEILSPGKIYIAKGDHHLEVEKRENRLISRVFQGDKTSGHRPSVDRLFRSLNHYCGKRSLAVLLTGMGADGAKQITKLKEEGAVTIGQSRESCVVYGMPRVAESLGGITHSLDLEAIYPKILELLDD